MRIGALLAGGIALLVWTALVAYAFSNGVWSDSPPLGDDPAAGQFERSLYVLGWLVGVVILVAIATFGRKRPSGLTHDPNGGAMTDSEWLQSLLISSELVSVVFVQDYAQFVFWKPTDNVTVSAFTMPSINGASFVPPGKAGYADALVRLINQVVVAAAVDKDTAFEIELSGGAKLRISLAPDDYRGPEAVMVQEEQSRKWNVW